MNGVDKPFLTVGEVARLFGCSSQWISKLVKAKRLETHRLQQRGWHRISTRSVIQYAAENNMKLNWELLQ